MQCTNIRTPDAARWPGARAGAKCLKCGRLNVAIGRSHWGQASQSRPL